MEIDFADLKNWHKNGACVIARLPLSQADAVAEREAIHAAETELLSHMEEVGAPAGAHASPISRMRDRQARLTLAYPTAPEREAMKGVIKTLVSKSGGSTWSSTDSSWVRACNVVAMKGHDRGGDEAARAEAMHLMNALTFAGAVLSSDAARALKLCSFADLATWFFENTSVNAPACSDRSVLATHRATATLLRDFAAYKIRRPASEPIKVDVVFPDRANAMTFRHLAALATLWNQLSVAPEPAGAFEADDSMLL